MDSKGSDEEPHQAVTRQFIYSSLRPDERRSLDHPLLFGDGHDGTTYAEWIEQKLAKIFLILVQIGAAHCIFDIIDQGFDDDDLPFSLVDIPLLDLSARGAGIHVDLEFNRVQSQLFSSSRPRSIHSQPSAPTKLAVIVIDKLSDTMDTVRISGTQAKVFTRRRIPFSKAPQYTSSEDFISELQYIKKSCHQHIVKIKTAYLSGNCGYVLFRPTLDITLQSLSNGFPNSFKSLPPDKRMSTLINWPHCLACALRFLHQQGQHHGKVLPSNIFIDNLNRVNLGFSDSTPIISCLKKENEAESYNYAAPEGYAGASAALSYLGQSRSQPNRSTRKFSIFRKRNGAASSISSAAINSEDIIPPVSPSTMSFVSSGPSSIAGASDSSSDSQSALFSSDSRWSCDSRSPPKSCHSFYDAQSVDSFDAFTPPPPRSGRSTSTLLSESLYESDWVAPWPEPPGADPRRGDIFSLACVILDILGLLLNGRHATFAAHREKRSRIIGALSDGSFQANLPAVLGFADELEKTAATRPEQLFRGVPLLLRMVRRMLDTNPEARPRIIEVVRWFEDVLIKTSELPFLHCGSGGLS